MSATKNILMSLLSGSILLFLLGNLDAYSQSTNNNTFANSVECFIHPCNESSNPLANNATSSNNQNTTTALIGISFNNITLQDIQDNKEKLKSSVSEYFNTTIDELASGNTVTYTFDITSKVLGEKCVVKKHDNCRIIPGIIVIKNGKIG